MLHRGKAHTYGLEGRFGIAYGASIVWFVGSIVICLPIFSVSVPHGLIASTFGFGISWLLGLVALAHRRSVWPLVLAESVTLVSIGIAWVMF